MVRFGYSTFDDGSGFRVRRVSKSDVGMLFYLYQSVYQKTFVNGLLQSYSRLG